MDPELIVVGGGPVGTTVAFHAAKALRTVVLEEHPQIGSPVQCTGLVHPRVVDMVSGGSSVLNQLTGFRMHFPGGDVLDIGSDEVKAVVIDREKFDRTCCDRALDAGAELITDARFTSFTREHGKLRVIYGPTSAPKSVTGDILVGADGYKSKVGKQAGIGRPKKIVRGIQVDIEHKLDDQSKVDVYLGRKVAPGFFAWMLPCGEFTRVGLGVSEGQGTPQTHLSVLLEELGLKNVKRKNIVSGAIPVGASTRTYADNILIVGDAAAQTKPLSGGGLFTGIIAARCAAETAVLAHERNDLSAASLSSYQHAWRSEIGKEVDRGYHVRRAFMGLSDRKLDAIGAIFQKEKVRKVLAQGDIDHPSRIASPLLRAAPSLVIFSPQIIGSFLWH